MDCKQTLNYLHAHLDRELDPVTAAGIEAHLQTCAACAGVYSTQTSLQAAVKKQAAYYPAPAALAATAVITWTTALQMETGSRDERIAEQVIAGHARSVLTNHLTEVASSDQHTVKPWLSSKLDFSPPATDLTAAGFPLVGARLDYVDSRPVAALVYRHRQHVINLFVWPDAKAGATGVRQPASKQGYNLLHWGNAGMTFWAISDLNQADIKTFAETYASAK